MEVLAYQEHLKSGGRHLDDGSQIISGWIQRAPWDERWVGTCKASKSHAIAWASETPAEN